MRRWQLTVAAAGLAAALAGCASNAPGDITPAASKVLTPAVERVRVAASSGSYSTLTAAVTELRNLVDQERQAGGVTSSRAAAIDDAADILLQDARSKFSPSPTPAPTSESPTPTTPPPTTPPPTTPPPTTPPPTTSPPSPVVSTSVGAAGTPAAHGHGSAHPSP